MSKHAINAEFSSLNDLVPTQPKKTLVIGDMDRWRAQGRALPDLDGLQFTDLQSLNDNMLAEYAPQIVFSPLMSNKFDAIDVARHLADLAFAGNYRAVTETVPNAEMIRAEVRQIAPKIDFDLVILPDAAPSA